MRLLNFYAYNMGENVFEDVIVPVQRRILRHNEHDVQLTTLNEEATHEIWTF